MHKVFFQFKNLYNDIIKGFWKQKWYFYLISKVCSYINISNSKRKHFPKSANLNLHRSKICRMTKKIIIKHKQNDWHLIPFSVFKGFVFMIWDIIGITHMTWFTIYIVVIDIQDWRILHTLPTAQTSPILCIYRIGAQDVGNQKLILILPTGY